MFEKIRKGGLLDLTAYWLGYCELVCLIPSFDLQSRMHVYKSPPINQSINQK